MRTFNRKSLLMGTLLSSAVMAAPAFAQDADDVEDEIVVTGSRISSANVVASSPVTTLDDEVFDRRGVIDAVDVLNTLPSVTAGQDSNVSNGATGTSSLNLRGLGANRNLVLIDGKRLGPGRPDISSADLNQIPTPLLERVEVVTGGASAVYGSDAIAGVANFILRRDFEGVELNANYGFFVDDNDNELAQAVTDASSTDGVTPTSTQVDGETFDISAVFGTNFDDGRGNVSAYARYVDQNAVLQGTRDISRCALLDLGPTPGPISIGNISCLGSNFGPFPTTLTLPTIFVTDADGNIVPGPDGNPQPLPGSTQGVVSLSSDGLIPRNPDGSIITGSSNAFNFNPTNFFQRPTERFQGGFLANYEVNQNAELYLDALFFRNVTDAQIAPSATFGEVQQINCDNPFLTAELVDLICTSRGFGPTDLASVQVNRRFVEGGGRNSKIELDNIRLVGGVRGQIGNSAWDYDVFGQYSITSQTDTNTNDGDINLLNEALQVGADGQCTSGRAGCIPLNLFGTGPVDPAALAAILTPTILSGEVSQTVVGASVQGELGAFSSPFADDSAAILLGVEYRKDKLQSQPDSILIRGGSTGLGGPALPTDAVAEVKEVFAELALPLIQDGTFAEDLSFTGQFRYSDYDYENGLAGGDQSDGTSSEAYSAGLSWTPVSDIRVRGQYQRAVRAPNVFELFDPTGLSLFSAADPCSGTTPSATLEACQRTGLNPALFGFVQADAGQLQQLGGGNIALEPEVSDTITLGAILRPSFAPGLTVSVDYFDISVDDFITNIPSIAILNGCLDNSQPEFCGFINRDAQGTLQVDGFVEANLQNIAERVSRGFDFNVGYATDLANLGLGDNGGVNFNYISTLYTALEQTSFPGDDPVDCLGFWGGACFTGEPNPEYAHQLSVGWESNFGVDVTATWRYVGEVEYGGPVGGFTFQENSVGFEFGAENYLDLFAAIDAGEKLEFGVGVNNLLDNDPPITDFRPTGINGNTFPSTYDSLGRYVFATAKVKL